MAKPQKFKASKGVTSPKGKSAAAPGRRFKALGLPNASSIAPGKTKAPKEPPSRVPPPAKSRR